MPTRNTGILRQIVQALGNQVSDLEMALARLEAHCSSRLITVAGDTGMIELHAQQLRLAITSYEASQVLDYIGEQHLSQIFIETAEEVINALFPDRFVKP